LKKRHTDRQKDRKTQRKGKDERKYVGKCNSNRLGGEKTDRVSSKGKKLYLGKEKKKVDAKENQSTHSGATT
jgi:hypothetical protein